MAWNILSIIFFIMCKKFLCSDDWIGRSIDAKEAWRRSSRTLNNIEFSRGVARDWSKKLNCFDGNFQIDIRITHEVKQKLAWKEIHTKDVWFTASPDKLIVPIISTLPCLNDLLRLMYSNVAWAFFLRCFHCSQHFTIYNATSVDLKVFLRFYLCIR